MSCLNGEPEIAEFVGKFASTASFRILQILAGSHYEGSRMLDIGFHQHGYIFRKMLSVAVEGDGIGKPGLEGISEPFPQRYALATVVSEVQNYGRNVHCLKQLHGVVGASVTDHNYIITLSLATAHHIHYGAGIIVGGDYHAYSP